MKAPSRIRGVSALRRLGGLLVSALLLLGPSGVPAATAAAPPACFAWDFTNSTGQDADGLGVAVRGVQQVTDVYAGEDNLFGAPVSQGYDAGADAYRLAFAGGLVVDGSQNHLGVCANRMSLRLASLRTGEPFFWTVDGKEVAPVPVFLGVSWARLPDGGLRITLYNDQDRPLTLWSAALLVTPSSLALDDLNAATVATLSGFADLGDDVIVLDAGATRPFDITAAALRDLPVGAALVLVAEFSGGDDGGDGGRLLAQLQMQQALYLPLIRR